jgi:hypothetical protein
MRYSITLFLSLLFCSLHAQWKDIPLSEFRDVIIKVEEQTAKSKSFSYHADIYLFAQHNSTDTMNTVSSNLVYNAKRKTINFNQLSNFIIQDETHQVVLDTVNKMVMLLDANPSYVQQKQFVDFELLLKSECKAQKMEKDKLQGFKISFAPGAQYASLELWLDSKLNVVKMVLYAGVDVIDDTDWNNVKTLRPRMEIYLSNYEFDKAAEKKNVIPISAVILDVDEKILAEQYKNYELIDMRSIRVN